MAIVAVVVAVGTGAWLGGRRFAALLIGGVVGAWLAPHVGPTFNSALVAVTGWNTWLGEALCWAAAYAGITAVASALVLLTAARVVVAERPSRASRVAGAAMGGCLAGMASWIALGNPADIVIEPFPSQAAASNTGIRRPLEVIRACRLLCSLDESEADLVTGRAEVRAVFAAKSFDRLLRTPGMLRRFSRAADGDWLALTKLATDPTVKEAMDDPEFIARVRAIDVVELAAVVERRRAGETLPADKSTAVAYLPSVVTEPEFRERIALEWLADRNEPAESSGPPRDPAMPASAAEVAAYWRTVGGVLEIVDRSTNATSWLPNVIIPPPVAEDSKIIYPPMNTDQRR